MLSLPFLKKGKSQKRAASEALRLAASRVVGSQLTLLKSFFLGITLAAIFYEVFPLPYAGPGRLQATFDSAVSEVIVVVAAWAGWFLVLQALHYRREARAVRMMSAPETRALLAKGFAEGRLEVAAAEALQKARVRRPDQTLVARRFAALARMAGRDGSSAERSSLLAQAEIDARKQDLSYAPIHVFIWAIPILGFIGTVVGIGDAIAEFSRFIQSTDPSGLFGPQMREALSGVTVGLALAFNTTLLALALTVPVMLATALLERAEEGMLLSLDELILLEFGSQPNASAETKAGGGEENPAPEWLTRAEQAAERFVGQADLAQRQLAGVQPLIKEFTDRLLDTTEQGRKPDSTSVASPAQGGEPAGPSRSGA